MQWADDEGYAWTCGMGEVTRARTEENNGERGLLENKVLLELCVRTTKQRQIGGVDCGKMFLTQLTLIAQQMLTELLIAPGSKKKKKTIGAKQCAELH